MGVVLAILKTVGWILLIILCLFLLLIALILLVPIRYRAEGNFHVPGEEAVTGRARITWLLHLILLSVVYEKELRINLKIAGILLYPRGKKERKAQNTSGDEEKKLSEEENLPEKENLPPSTREPSGDEGHKRAPDEAASAQSYEERPDGKEGLLERLGRKAENLNRNAETILDSLSAKMRHFRELWDYYTELLNNEGTQKVIRSVFLRIRSILMHIRPSILKADLEVGTGDPASTANILAVNGMFYPLVGDKIHIKPDFDNKKLEGNFFIKGRVRLCIPLFHVLMIVCDRKTWKLIRKLKKEETDDGRS